VRLQTEDTSFHYDQLLWPISRREGQGSSLGTASGQPGWPVLRTEQPEEEPEV
jgi:hypothetical protein